MGDFTLGCLLGQYDKAQSFDVDSVALPTGVNSWGKVTGQSSLYFRTLQTHSSDQILQIDNLAAVPTPNTILQYKYGYDEDAYGRWFPEVDTHSLRSTCFARVANSQGSGDTSFRLLAGTELSVPIAYSPAQPLFPYILETNVFSEGNNRPYFEARISDNTSVTALYLDDVLTQVDWFTLHPEYSFQEQARTIRSQHRTLGGKLHTYTWDKYFAYQVPLRYLSDSYAALLNWWWENQFNLAFTLDTSDSESTLICRIVNETQPIGSRIRPYDNMWQGMVQLESIDRGSLVF